MFAPLLIDNAEWESHKKDNPDYIENIYFSLGEIGGYALKAIENKDIEMLKKIFTSIEFVFVAGDKVSQEKICTGFIESLQNNMIEKNIDLSSLNEYLGPQLKKEWQNIIEFWNPETKSP